MSEALLPDADLDRLIDRLTIASGYAQLVSLLLEKSTLHQTEQRRLRRCLDRAAWGAVSAAALLLGEEDLPLGQWRGQQGALWPENPA